MDQADAAREFLRLPDFSADDRVTLSKMTVQDDCFSSSRSSKERRVNAYCLMAFGGRIMEHHKKIKKWYVDMDAIRLIHTVYTAVRRANPVSTRSIDKSFAFIGEVGLVVEDTVGTEVRETPEYIEKDDEDLYAVEEYDES